MKTISKDTIIKNFSKAARTYRYNDKPQRASAEYLFSMIKGHEFRNILEIGCGTGFYTKIISDHFNSARITALDISDKMIDMASSYVGGNVEFINTDAEKYHSRIKYDLITSNASLQWVSNMGETLSGYSDMLSEGGMFAVSVYGPDTYRELKFTLKECYGTDVSISSDLFMDETPLRAEFGKHFKILDFQCVFFEENFLSLMDMLKNIEHSGTRGFGLKNAYYMGKNSINLMEKIYLRAFGAIRATHQIFFIKTIAGEE